MSEWQKNPAVQHRKDAMLVQRAVRNAKPKKVGMHPRWMAVRDVFACGQITAEDLCRRFGLDPWDSLQGPFDVCPECGDEVMDEQGFCPGCS